MMEEKLKMEKKIRFSDAIKAVKVIIKYKFFNNII